MLFILDFVDKNVNNIHLNKFSEVKVKFQLTPMGVLAPKMLVKLGLTCTKLRLIYASPPAHLS